MPDSAPPAAPDPEVAGDDPRILVVAAAELSEPLAAIGLEPTNVEDLARLVRPRHGLGGRAIILGPAAVDAASEHGLDAAIDAIRTSHPLVDVVFWRPDASPDLVRAAMRAGARDVVLAHGPASVASVAARIVRGQRMLTRAADLGFEEDRDATFHGILSRSRAMWDLFDLVRRVAATDAAILLTGETGTGKELLARAVHRASGRDGRFVAVNCNALPESLIDSELFGHERGAFTGAARAKAGLFRHAEGGTIMLDEIGQVPTIVQNRLLRVLQERTVRPVGSHGEVPIDVRVIAATSSDLDADVAAGRFREDLYYRLDVIRLEVPPLRERPEDIVFLFGHFARIAARTYDLQRPDVTDDFLDALLAHDWPGNVRELEHFSERLLLTHPHGTVDGEVARRLLGGRPAAGSSSRTSAAAPTAAAPPEPADSPSPPVPFLPRPVPAADAADWIPPLDLDRPMAEAVGPLVDELERAYLAGCLQATRGRVGQAADRAGISRRTLLRRMQSLGLDKADFRTSNPSDPSETSP